MGGFFFIAKQAKVTTGPIAKWIPVERETIAICTLNSSGFSTSSASGVGSHVGIPKLNLQVNGFLGTELLPNGTSEPIAFLDGEGLRGGSGGYVTYDANGNAIGGGPYGFLNIGGYFVGIGLTFGQ